MRKECAYNTVESGELVCPMDLHILQFRILGPLLGAMVYIRLRQPFCQQTSFHSPKMYFDIKHTL